MQNFQCLSSPIFCQSSLNITPYLLTTSTKKEKVFSDIVFLLEKHVFFFQAASVVLYPVTKALEYLCYFYFSRPLSVIHLLKNNTINWVLTF